MKLRKIAALMALVLVAVTANAREKVVYGNDDRLDVFETTNTLHVDLSESTAAMISATSLTSNGNGTVNIQGTTLESRGICGSEKFAKQMTAANCSGFLVGKNLIVTAGHCVTSQSACDSYRWVFDYKVDSADKITFEVPESSVYKCKEILSQTLNRSTSDDFALLKLDRDVTDRNPLEVRTKDKIEAGAPLVVIGHPTGLPTKIAAGANVRNNDNAYYFVANLDTFAGNSGSAVFNSENGVVEGILVRGETDYEYDYQRGCRVPKYCSNEGCRGEDVTRITNIKKLMDILNGVEGEQL